MRIKFIKKLIKKKKLLIYHLFKLKLKFEIKMSAFELANKILLDVEALNCSNIV
jgi:hypothetical protein